MPADIDEHPMEGLEPDNTQSRMAEEVIGWEEVPYQERNENYVEEKQGGHYYDSIPADEFEMPEVFEVEIKLADN